MAIGNDTGPMHLLATVGCASLVLFSGDSDPARCAPRAPPDAPAVQVSTRQSRDLTPEVVTRAVDTLRAILPVPLEAPADGHQPLSLPSAAPAARGRVPLPQRYWAILTIALGLTLAVLDGSSPMSRCRRSRATCRPSPSASIWVVNAYQLAVTISLLPLASLGDIFGYRRIYQAVWWSSP